MYEHHTTCSCEIGRIWPRSQLVSTGWVSMQASILRPYSQPSRALRLLLWAILGVFPWRYTPPPLKFTSSLDNRWTVVETRKQGLLLMCECVCAYPAGSVLLGQHTNRCRCGPACLLLTPLSVIVQNWRVQFAFVLFGDSLAVKVRLIRCNW